MIVILKQNAKKPSVDHLLTDLTGLPFTEEPKRAKEWDNYLELVRRMEDALAADGLR